MAASVIAEKDCRTANAALSRLTKAGSNIRCFRQPLVDRRRRVDPCPPLTPLARRLDGSPRRSGGRFSCRGAVAQADKRMYLSGRQGRVFEHSLMVLFDRHFCPCHKYTARHRLQLSATRPSWFLNPLPVASVVHARPDQYRFRSLLLQHR